MRQLNKDNVRRLLASVLTSLDAEPRQGAEGGREESSLPVVMIVLSQPGTDQAEMFDLGSERAASPAARAPHPGLEKFPVAQSSSCDSAPKNCFMEPDRLCVNSGACETRGY